MGLGDSGFASVLEFPLAGTLGVPTAASGFGAGLTKNFYWVGEGADGAC